MERKVKFKTPELQAVYDEVRDYFIRNKFKIARVEQVKGNPCLVVYETYKLWEESPGDIRTAKVSRNAGERGHWTWGVASARTLGRIYLHPSELSWRVNEMTREAIELACKKLGVDWAATIKTPFAVQESTRLQLICENGLVFGYRVKHLWAAKYLTKLLWRDVLNPEALNLATKLHVRAPEVTFESYSFARKNQTILKRLEREASNLFPVLREMVEGETSLSLEAFGLAREHKLARGVTPAMWRWLAKQTVAVVNKMLENQRLWELLAATSERAPYFVVVSLMRSRLAETFPGTEFAFFETHGTANPEYKVRGEQTRNNLVLFLRLALREARTRKGRLKAFVNTELMLAVDWIRAEYALTSYEARATTVLKALPSNLGWAGVMRAQQVWHEDMALREPSGPNLTWESLLPAQDLDGYAVAPLSSTVELVQEGRILHHCVGGYSDTCASGRARVFSLVSNKERATLELVCLNDKWRVSQVRSYCNSGVSKAAAEVSRKLAADYQAAWKKLSAPQRSAPAAGSKELRMAA